MSGRLKKCRNQASLRVMNGKLILVTGGAGFIGSNLIRRLVDEGNHVISLDNNFAGDAEAIDGVIYRHGHTKDINELISEMPDCIYHLGEYSRVEQSVLEPDLVHDLNVVGTTAVIEFWRKCKSKLIYAGSSTKFGDGGDARYTSPYARSKADNTERIKKIGEAENLPFAITYFYNVYGPGERSGVYGTVIENFKSMYLRGTPLIVIAPGTQERNFTHVDDIVDGLMIVGEKGNGDEFGLGNATSHRIIEIARLFQTDIILAPEREGNRMQSGIDTSKTNALGWHASRSVEEYIRTFLAQNPRGAALEKRILVLSTTFHPIVGPAENALCDTMASMSDVHFDIITTVFSKDAHLSICPVPNAHVYRVGSGRKSDKYLLPILGLKKARELHRVHQYLFAWSLMASYAALAGVLLKRTTKLPLLITIADQNFVGLAGMKRAILSLVLSNADQVYGGEVREEDASHPTTPRALRRSIGDGDAFANMIRFAYADFLRKRIVK